MNAPLPFSVHKQLNLDIFETLIVDLFAGGGGNSYGIEEATGRRVSIALNHDENAISMHAKNHPDSVHLREDIRSVSPRTVAGNRPIGLLHMSPDCRDFSQSKGGQPRSKVIRGLTWQGLKWAGQVAPYAITLENVKQITTWGPLVAKRDKATGRVVKLDESIAAPGEVVPIAEQFLIPDPKRKGKYWAKFLASLRQMGYAVDYRVLCAADYGTATSRERLFMVARRDGQPIRWPEPTHSKDGKDGKPKWLGACTVIDFDIPCPSIFARKKELAPATLRRIAKGLKRFVIDNPDPFIVPLTHQGGDRVHDINDPMRTITAAHRGELALANPCIVPIAHYNQMDTVHDAADPLRTITAATKGGEFSLMAPVLAKFRGDSAGASVQDPMPTITSGGESKRPAGAPHAMGVIAPVLVQAGHGEGKPDGVKRWGCGSRAIGDAMPTITASGSGGQSLAVATMVQTGYGEREGQSPRALDIEQPLGTIVAGAVKHAPVVAYLAQQNGGFNVTPGHVVDDPLSTITNSGSQQQLVTANLATLRRNCVGVSANDPVPTLTAGAEHHALIESTLVDASDDFGLSPEQKEGAVRVAAFLMRYYGQGGQWSDPRDPLPTITTKDRMALVTVTLKGIPYVIVDIGLRMLSSRELYSAQGFPLSYIIDHGHDGRRFSKSAQVKMVGNSVPPKVTKALVEANFPDLCIHRKSRRRAA